VTRYQWPPGPPTTQPDDPRARADYELRHRALIELLRRPEAPEAGPGPARAAIDRAPPTGGAFQWLPIGPSTVVRGQAGGRPRVSGRVRDVAVDDDGRRIYAATATGGVWYSEDSGTTWSPLGGWVTDANPATGASASALSCGCLHVEFNDPAAGVEDVVYVGTGELVGPREGAGRPGRRMRGVGVLRLGSPLATVLANPFQDAFDREAKNLAGYGIYRIARDPANPDRLVAATSAGLFTRTGPFVQDADWTRVTVPPFNFDADDGPFCTDVLWNPGAGAVPARLWVALVAPGNPAQTAVYVSTGGVAGPFTPVALAGAAATFGSRLGLAATPFDRSVVYVLGSGPALWRIDGTTPQVVGQVPTALFGATGDQSDYDLAIAVKPDTADRIIIAGSTLQSDGEWSASLFRCTVTGPAGAGPYNLDFLPANNPAPTTDPTYVGNGVHADVHQVRWFDTPLQSEVWVACDGGLFRSRRDGDQYSFAERSTALAALECGYVGTHPTLESVVVAGTQDNGTLRRIGDTLWRVEHLGDGGGVVVHRGQPLSYVYQYTQAAWRSNDASGAYVRPVFRTSHVGNASEQAEDVASEFYSGASIRPGAAAGADRVALGSTRVWISEDWSPGGAAMTWGTLPSGAARAAADPRGVASLDSVTDNLRGGPIVACRWVTDDRVVALGNRAVNVWTRAPAGVGVWTRAEISFHDGRTKSGGRFGDSDIETPTSPVLPPLGGWSDVAVHQPGTGANGTYYVATTGHAAIKDDAATESTRMDTLWWYDGTSRWHPTGLRNAPTGTKAPAYAVAVDPEDDTIVYVGTALGVWHGVRAGGAGTPTWAWQPFGDGLPEAPVEDLSFFFSGTTKLLRAAVRALGVWELDFSAAPVAPGRVYLRAHADDRRRGLPSDRVDPTQAAGVLADWGASPDIRVRPSPLNPPPPPPASLGPGMVWSAAVPPPTPYELWVLQLALHFGDATVRPTGVWDAFFERRLRAFRVANGQADVAQVDATTWTNANDALSSWMPPWDGVQPTEADLHELIVERRAGPPVPRTRIDRHQTAIDVLIHRRDVRPVPDTTVRAMLLRRHLDPADLDGAAVAIDAAWRQAVVDRLTGAGAPAALPAGWDLPAGAPGTQRPTGDLDARRPRPVTFTVDWSAQPSGSLWLLVAVASADADPASNASLPGATLLDLALGSHHVAVTRVEVS
jgi:hypothetical protein